MRKVWSFMLCGWFVFVGLLMIAPSSAPSVAAPSRAPEDGQYTVLAWNDLGMHCYNRDFQYLAVLPPFNTLWAQVIRMGNPPQIVTTGITVTYHFTDNTYSVGKSNFWDYEQQLFGVDLAPNVGLAGKGMSGTLDLQDTHFVATGIPLTEYRDSDYVITPTNTPRYPFQLATVTVWDAATGAKLAETISVAPVSTEMHCDTCHSDGDQDGIATGSVELNILTLHDQENMDEYPVGHTGALVSRTPVLCAECHSSNALGAPGAGEVPSLSNAMHNRHTGESPDTLNGCYNCHPGPQTQCLRDVMSQRGMDCMDCHGGMAQVAANANPWLNEPRCDNTGCHAGGDYNQNQALYRMSSGHGGVYCEGCHDSTHAIAPSSQANDAIKFMMLQGVNQALGGQGHCTTCHTALPLETGPHGIMAPVARDFSFTPDHTSAQALGATVVYTHTLQNTGNVSDTYDITWTSSRQWADVTIGSETPQLPLPLDAHQSVVISVTVTVPNTQTVRGLWDTTLVTATSLLENALIHTVQDVTRAPNYFLYLPLVTRQ